MEVIIQDTPAAMGFSAAKKAAGLILGAISTKGTASIIMATGTSQFETLKQLIAEKEIDWSRVILFHLDEYIGIPDTHPASFRKYIKERFLEKLPPLKSVYLIPGEEAPEETCKLMSAIIRIMLSDHIICSVPDLRKAAAVRDCMEKEVSNLFPATILKNHKSCFLFLDKQAASLVANSV